MRIGGCWRVLGVSLPARSLAGGDSGPGREVRAVKLDRDIMRKLPLALRVEIEENALRKALTQSELAIEQRRIIKELRKHTRPGDAHRPNLRGCFPGGS